MTLTRVDSETGEVVKVTLADCEKVIEAGFAQFIEVGLTLILVRDERLYREANFKTFESYCEQRWSEFFGSRIRAYQFMDAAQVAQSLSTNGLQMPANERQARALVPLKENPDAMVEAFTEAQRRAESEDRTVTAALIEKVVDEKLGREKGRPWIKRGRAGTASQVIANLRALADSIAALDVTVYRATQEEVEGLDRTIKALRKLRHSLVVEK